MLFRIQDLLAGNEILSGVAAGRKVFTRLVSEARSSGVSEAVFLDFSGVRVATSSFLRESVIAFRDYARSTLTDLYPVLANCGPLIIEELAFFLKHTSDALWLCDLKAGKEPTNVRLVGELDEVQQTTLQRVIEAGSTTAPALASGSTDKIGPTAWNNRLSGLAARGLIIERRDGKTKTFKPVLGI